MLRCQQESGHNFKIAKKSNFLPATQVHFNNSLVQFIAALLATKFSRKYEMEGSCKPLFKIVLMKLSLFTPIPYPHQSTIHTSPYFLVGIICGPKWGSFPIRDRLRSNLGSFAVRDHLWSGNHLPTRTAL